MRAIRILAVGVLAGALMLPGAGAGATGAMPQCKSSDLAGSYRGGDAAMSHTYGRIVLKNVSDSTCLIHGYGGLSYVGHGDGTQIGAAADRTGGTVPTIALEPGKRVISRVVETSYAPYPKRKCHPTPVDGFRVYVPNSTTALYIPHPTTGCRNHAVHLLSHKAYHRP